jgi:hypothetical protein
VTVRRRSAPIACGGVVYAGVLAQLRRGAS